MMAYIFLSAQVSMQWRLCPGSLDWLHDWILKFLNLEFPAKKCFLFWLHIKRVVKCTLHFQFRSTLKYKFTIQNKIINAHIFAVKFVHLFFFYYRITEAMSDISFGFLQIPLYWLSTRKLEESVNTQHPRSPLKTTSPSAATADGPFSFICTSLNQRRFLNVPVAAGGRTSSSCTWEVRGSSGLKF